MEIRFVTAESQDFIMLARKPDEYYFKLVGDIHLRYTEANRPENNSFLIVAYIDELPIGIGCWKAVDRTTAELKRIYVLPEYRRKGVASKIIHTLEESISAARCQHIMLETARTTPASEALYLTLGYR